jgi:type II secretion system protein I
MRLSSASRRPGLSLLEVLGATAIFLMSIVAIGELMNMSTDQAMEVQWRSRATRLCQSKLNDFSSGVEQLNGATSGEFEEEPEWSWQADVVQESSAADLYRVTITVSRDTYRGLIEVKMTQFIFDPLQRGNLMGSSAPTASTETTTSGSTGSTSGTSGSGANTGSGNSGNSGSGGAPKGGGGGGAPKGGGGGSPGGSKGGGGGGRPTGGGGKS